VSGFSKKYGFTKLVVIHMTKLTQRLSEFNVDSYPNEDVPVEALCKDKNGTYVIPYSCCRYDDEWRNFETDEKVSANIIGWRPISEKRRYRPLRKK
jgi:hypothetical protein